MSLIDANIVLRYLLDDHAKLSAQAAAILEQQAVTLPIEAACEHANLSITEQQFNQRGKTLWDIADQPRGARNREAM